MCTVSHGIRQSMQGEQAPAETECPGLVPATSLQAPGCGTCWCGAAAAQPWQQRPGGGQQPAPTIAAGGPLGARMGSQAAGWSWAGGTHPQQQHIGVLPERPP